MNKGGGCAGNIKEEQTSVVSRVRGGFGEGHWKGDWEHGLWRRH